MTLQECKDIVLEWFQKLYPGCTVIHSYPGYTVRPSLPYIVLEFQRETFGAQHQTVEDGILQQAVAVSVPLLVEMAARSKTVQSDGIKKVVPETVVEDLFQSILYFSSAHAEDLMRLKDLWVVPEGNCTPIYGTTPGVERAQCSFTLNFILHTKEYAALAPQDGAYAADRASSASKDLADMEAGYFEEAEILYQGSDTE